MTFQTAASLYLLMGLRIRLFRGTTLLYKNLLLAYTTQANQRRLFSFLITVLPLLR